MEDSEIIADQCKIRAVLRRDCLSCAAQPGGLGGVRQ